MGGSNGRASISAPPRRTHLAPNFCCTIRANHNHKRLQAKRHVSYTARSSRSYVAASFGVRLIRTRKCLQACRKCCIMNAPLGAEAGLSRGLSASTPPAREHRRTTRRVPLAAPRKTTGSALRSSPIPRTRRAAAPVSCSGTSGTRLFVCRRPEPRTRAGIPCRRTQRWA